MKKFREFILENNKSLNESDIGDIFDFLLSIPSKVYEKEIKKIIDEKDTDELIKIKDLFEKTNTNSLRFKQIYGMISEKLKDVSVGFEILIKDPFKNKKSFVVKNGSSGVYTNISTNFSWMIKNYAEVPSPKGNAAETKYLREIVIDAFKKSNGDISVFNKLINLKLSGITQSDIQPIK